MEMGSRVQLTVSLAAWRSVMLSVPMVKLPERETVCALGETVKVTRLSPLPVTALVMRTQVRLF